MPEVPPELTWFLTDAKKFADEYGPLLTLLGLIAGAVKLFVGRRRNKPNLQFELADVSSIKGDKDITFCLKVTNIGGDPATEVQYTWTQRSTCTMTPVPANFMLRKDDPRCFAFSMRAADMIVRRLTDLRTDPLGWLELTYSVGWSTSRRVGRAIFIGESPDVPVRHGKVPWKPWGEIIIPLGRWREKRYRDKDIQNLDQALQRSRDFLAARGIEVNLIFPGESFNRLLDELQNRAWESSYGPGGCGYEVYARKDYPPSSGMTIRLSANTAVDAATLVVASAIESDERH